MLPLHAQYDHSFPSANARLLSGEPPREVRVWFTEQVEPDFSRLEVYDQARQRVDQNDSHSVVADTSVLTISLRTHLPDGAYTVVYHTVSVDDGHEVTGNFSFVVGTGLFPTNTDALIAQNQGSDSNFTLWSVAIRWLNYIGMAGLVGGIAFYLFVWFPGYQALKPAMELELAHVRMQQRVHQMMGVSLLLAGSGWLAFLSFQASVVSSSSLWEAVSHGVVLNLLLHSRFGIVWFLRLFCIAGIAGVWFIQYWSQTKRAFPAFYVIALIAGAGIMLTTALNSHEAANTYAWILVPLDLLHLMSTGFWIGGLAALIITVSSLFPILKPGTGDRTRVLGALLPHFSRIATVCVVVLMITGSVQACVALKSWEALFGSAYGRVLVVKLVLFALLLGCGGWNLLRISPRMRAFAASSSPESGAPSIAAGRLQRLFKRIAHSELAVALVLLVVVSGLTSMSPPPPPAEHASAGAFIKQGRMNDISYSLVINPAQVGSNTSEVLLKDQTGQPVQQVDAVLLRFTMLDMAMGVEDMTLVPVAGKAGYYSASGTNLSMAGHWQVDLIVRRPAHDVAKVTMEITLTRAISMR
ncbi:copper transport protein YcnJ [Tengunoibacter tsumagoiensis]|uniref:Copper transport protein YcnJ n=1 Tax=Tengunoibacter tsumagoiensis TaxID=2014871 RepID=A0A402AAD5_9CHLR|nr:copper transport protein YcnJ [Tengunoibacter tsumagoiensis]